MDDTSLESHPTKFARSIGTSRCDRQLPIRRPLIPQIRAVPGQPYGQLAIVGRDPRAVAPRVGEADKLIGPRRQWARTTEPDVGVR